MAVLLAAVLQAGCNDKGAEYAQVPSVPLIQQAMESQVPLFNGKPHTRLMELVCSFVAGDITREQFAAFFIAHNIDVKALASEDPGFALIAKGDMPDLAQGCAAYIITRFSSWPVFAMSENESITDEEKLSERLTKLTSTTLEVSAYVAKLAMLTSQTRYESIPEYKHEVAEKMSGSAQEFVKKVMHQKADVSAFDTGGKKGGYAYSFTHNSIALYLYGALWFGNGKAQGSEFTVQIKNP